MSNRIKVIDSHAGGAPPRVIVSGGPDLGSGPIQERLDRFREHFDHIRSAVVNEPRGNDAIVGALLCEPHDPTCQAGVIFFNNVEFLNMCGHGTIGLMVTLPHMGRISRGVCRIDTNCGPVEARLNANGSVTIRNVPSFRSSAAVPVNVPGIGRIHGDIAWGGNWFFLIGDHHQQLLFQRIEELTDYTWRVRQALEAQGIAGADGRQIDHIELFGPPSVPGADSKNFVLCPGKAYDRSPCGTGTSAKLACLSADGKLHEGDVWRQESLIGSIFEGSIKIVDGRIRPQIRGTAYVNAESTLIVDPADPLAM